MWFLISFIANTVIRYPTDSDKQMLATQTGLSRNQVAQLCNSLFGETFKYACLLNYCSWPVLFSSIGLKHVDGTIT